MARDDDHDTSAAGPAAPTAPEPASGHSSGRTAGRRPRVAVVFGGRSSEHEISCVTAGSVLAAIDRDSWDVTAVGITRDGAWVLAPDEPKRWQIESGELPEVAADDGPALSLAVHRASPELTVLGAEQVPQQLLGVDVVLPLLHGPFGEDGTLQGMLELAGVRYVGSGVLASAASMDKHYMKILLAGAGLPIGDYVVVPEVRWRRHRDQVYLDVEELGFPVFVKPARAGSSIGITKVHSAEDLAAAIETAQQHDPKVVIEAAVIGREIECAVLESPDGEEPATSLPGEIEIVGDHEFYDFEAKYLDESAARLSCPADLPDRVARQVRDLAGRAFTALGCEGLARVDFFVTAEGTVMINEVNTMPGFTPISMYPRMWECTGLAYPDLIDRLLSLALRRRVGLR